MQFRATTRVSLTALLGTPVTDAKGQMRGRLKDVAVATGPDAGRVAGLVLKSRSGLLLVPSQEVMETPAGAVTFAICKVFEPLPRFTFRWPGRITSLLEVRPAAGNNSGDSGAPDEAPAKADGG